MASICQIGISLLLIIVTLLSYQKVATIIDDYRFPPLGTRVDVGGYKLHIYSNGTGGPTVVLDAGLSGTSLGWSLNPTIILTYPLFSKTSIL
jgi:hypothetical protein